MASLAMRLFVCKPRDCKPRDGGNPFPYPRWRLRPVAQSQVVPRCIGREEDDAGANVTPSLLASAYKAAVSTWRPKRIQVTKQLEFACDAVFHNRDVVCLCQLNESLSCKGKRYNQGD